MVAHEGGVGGPTLSLRRNIWTDRITELELQEPVLVTTQTSVRRTVETMRARGIGCALVCESEDLVGIFTERDFVKRVLAPGGDLDRPVCDFMTPEPVTAQKSYSVGVAIRTMYRGRYRHLPVLDEQDRPIGVISVKRVVQYLVDHFPSAVYNLPPDPRQIQETREGA